MTEFTRPAQAFSSTVSGFGGRVVSDEVQDLQYAHFAYTTKVGVQQGTGYYGTVKARNTTERWENINDTVYASLVSAGVDFSGFRSNSNVAPTSPAQANSSSVPALLNLGLHKQIIFFLGDSIGASDVGGGTFPDQALVTNKLWSQGISGADGQWSGSNGVYNLAPGSNSSAWAQTARWAHQKSRLIFNFCTDSWRLANQAGFVYSSGNNWTDNFSALSNFSYDNTKQQLVFTYQVGTNDVAYADLNGNPGMSAVPAGTLGYTFAGSPNYFTDCLLPLIALAKAAYPFSRQHLITPIVRGTTGTLNPKFVEIAQYANANRIALGLDFITDMTTVPLLTPGTPSNAGNGVYMQNDLTHPTPTGTKLYTPLLLAAFDSLLLL